MDASTWPTPFDAARAAPITRTLRAVLTAARDFAISQRA